MKKQPSEWLKYRSKITGKSVEELREDMRQRGAKQDKTKVGFTNRELARKAGALGGAARREKK